MLSELRITDLGVIESVSLLLGPGMTALTGETGAGKTMVVEAIELLVGGRADPAMVRAGAAEAVVEGRFVTDDDPEVVLRRVVPAVGRSRGYVDGRLAPAAALAELGAGLVDLHGQHAHQSLLATATQRQALDRFGAVDLGPLQAARAELARIDAALTALGGDERARAREIDLVRFQVAELAAAAVDDPDEDAALDAEEDRLGDAVAHREAAAQATGALAPDDGGALDALAAALAAIAGRAPFAELERRLRDLVAEVGDVAAEVRAVGEAIEDDPARLAWLRERRQLLRELRRKYGDTLAEVIAFAAAAGARLAALEDHDRRAAALDAGRAAATAAERDAAAAVAAARRAAAPRLAAAVQAHLGDLAMARARLAVDVAGPEPGDAVAFLLATDPGAPLAPLAKVASGGELARAMLALRLVLSAAPGGDGARRRNPRAGDVPTTPSAAPVQSSPPAPATLVFDEVDAGIGGATALAVGRALGALGRADRGSGAPDLGRQVLVVTHLAQVAAAADAHVVVAKVVVGGGANERTTASVALVEGEARLVELSRMLAGQPESVSARELAEDLLASARVGRS
jgi:DNA repair protein RecN (Recombination protein N)